MPPIRHAPLWYRLTAPLPFDVVFPSITYRIDIVHPHSGYAGVQLYGRSRRQDVVITEFFYQREWLEEALQVAFVVGKATVGETVMERAITMGFAERAPAPLVLPEIGRGRPRV